MWFAVTGEGKGVTFVACASTYVLAEARPRNVGTPSLEPAHFARKATRLCFAVQRLSRLPVPATVDVSQAAA